MAMNFDFFNKWVQDNLGIRLEAYKERQMQRRIGNIMQTTGAKTLEEYAKILSKDSKAREDFIEHLTINVTEFYRNKDIFDEFEDVLKKIVVKNTSRPKIWSAACSTGAEPYTLAMILDKTKSTVRSSRRISTRLSWTRRKAEDILCTSLRTFQKQISAIIFQKEKMAITK